MSFENEFTQYAMSEGMNTLGYGARGLKSVVIVMENECSRCNGEGKRPKFMQLQRVELGEPDLLPEREMVDCAKCNGSGLIEIKVNLDVTRTPGKKTTEEKKK